MGVHGADGGGWGVVIEGRDRRGGGGFFFGVSEDCGGDVGEVWYVCGVVFVVLVVASVSSC